MEYKGYTASIEIDEGAGIIFGRVLGTEDVLTFHGSTEGEVVQAFRDTIDDYLDWCEELDQEAKSTQTGQASEAS